LGGARGRLIASSARKETISLIREAGQSGARMQKACELMGISTRTLVRWNKEDGDIDKRHLTQNVPVNKLTIDEKNEIIATANSEKYCDLPPCKIVPLLADEGCYLASESSFYRVLKAENQLAHRGRTKPAKHHKPKELTANAPNQVFTWDITYLPTTIIGMHYYLYLIMDIFSRKIVGFSVHENESSDHAACLIKQTYHDEKIKPDQVTLHSDNGSPMKGATMLAMLQQLGVIPSFSRPSISDDNPYSESLFKTIKYHPTFPAIEKFATITDARVWCEKFVYWYNNQHLHSGLKFVTPNQRHTGDDHFILTKRHLVYQQAKLRHPERWSKNTRNWVLPRVVTLNPNKKLKKIIGQQEQVIAELVA
jgi:transposase InsO family protein